MCRIGYRTRFGRSDGIFPRDRLGEDRVESGIGASQRGTVLGADIDGHRRERRDRVDRRTAFDQSDAGGGLGVGGQRHGTDPRHRVRHGIGRAHQPEIFVGMAARPAKRHLVALRTHTAIGDHARTVRLERNEGRDPVLERTLLEQIANAAQIARSLLADIAQEQNVGVGMEFRGVHRARDREQYRQACRVVADAGRTQRVAMSGDLDGRAGGKDGIEVRRHDDQRAAAGAPPKAEHIAFGIGLHVVKAGLHQHLAVEHAARLFPERRRPHFGQADDGLDDTVIVPGNRCPGASEPVTFHENSRRREFGVHGRRQGRGECRRSKERENRACKHGLTHPSRKLENGARSTWGVGAPGRPGHDGTARQPLRKV
jgi:hypothetical protein